MRLPLLSIVIANYNYGRFLEEAIQSVVEQDGFDQCELIIVDGGSTDNSVEIIRKYADKIAWWCTEKDSGQSAAFNKGFSHAKGEYLTWLNADDVFVKGCLRRVITAMERHPDCEWFTGNMLRFLEDGRVIEIGWGPHWYPSFLQRKDSPVVVFGPTTFFSKKIYEAVDRIDESLHHAMDYDLWLKFMMMGIKQRRVSCFCWAFRMHEASKTAEFGTHKISPELRARAKREERYIYNNTGYKCSKAVTVLMKLWRIFDLSIPRGIFYRFVYKKFEY